MSYLLAQAGASEPWLWGVAMSVVGGMALWVGIRFLSWFPKSDERQCALEVRLLAAETSITEMRRTIESLDAGHSELNKSINDMRVEAARQYATLKAGQDHQASLLQTLLANLTFKEPK